MHQNMLQKASPHKPLLYTFAVAPLSCQVAPCKRVRRSGSVDEGRHHLSGAQMSLIAVLLLFISFYRAAECLDTDGVVLFGDSLSDNGNGFAGNVKFVLRTNEARRRLMIDLINTQCLCLLQNVCDAGCEVNDQSKVLRNPSVQPCRRIQRSPITWADGPTGLLGSKSQPPCWESVSQIMVVEVQPQAVYLLVSPDQIVWWGSLHASGPSVFLVHLSYGSLL